MSEIEQAVQTQEASDASEASSAYEYAFEKVPEDKRKSGASIFVVLAGYAISLSNFVLGTTIGSKMPFKDAILASLWGNLFLIIVAILLGLLAFSTGLSTSFLSRKAFGRRGSAIFSVLLTISAINWIAVNADTFSKMIKTTFSWWPLPAALTAILVVAMWAQSSIRGYKGLEIVSWLGVPAAIALTIACIVAVGIDSNGFQGAISFVPEGPHLTFTAASASVVGGWIFGCIITPDVCRFAKNKMHVAVGGFFAFIIGLFGLQLCGILVAAATGAKDFVAATAALGLGVLVFLCAVFCLWTTQDNNIYGASLAMQNVFEHTPLEGKVTHKTMAIIIAACSAVFAAAGALKYLLPVVQSLSVLLPPIPGLIVGECFFVKHAKDRKEINWVAIMAWIGGGIVGYAALKANFFISPVCGMAATLVLYIILSKLLDNTLNKDVMDSQHD